MLLNHVAIRNTPTRIAAAEFPDALLRISIRSPPLAPAGKKPLPLLTRSPVPA